MLLDSFLIRFLILQPPSPRRPTYTPFLLSQASSPIPFTTPGLRGSQDDPRINHLSSTWMMDLSLRLCLSSSLCRFLPFFLPSSLPSYHVADLREQLNIYRARQQPVSNVTSASGPEFAAARYEEGEVDSRREPKISSHLPFTFTFTTFPATFPIKSSID